MATGGAFTATAASGTGTGTGAATANTGTVTPIATMELPKFDSVFTHLPMWTRINQLLGVVLSTTTATTPAGVAAAAATAAATTPSATTTTTTAETAGHELLHLLTHRYRDVLLQPTLPQHWTDTQKQQHQQQQNAAMFQKLSQVPTVSLQDDDDTIETETKAVTVTATTTTLSATVISTIYRLASDLDIPYPHAATLYAQVSGNLPRMRQLLESLSSSSSSLGGQHTADNNQEDDPIRKACHDFYQQECLLPFKTIVRLIHARLVLLPSHPSSASTSPWEAPLYLLQQATDQLLQQKWIDSLVTCLEECTLRIQLLQTALEQQVHHNQQQQQQQQQSQQQYQHHASTASTPISSFGNNNSDGNSAITSRLSFQLRIAMNARHMIGEALYFLAYQTQWNESEFSLLLDQTHELSHLCVLGSSRSTRGPSTTDVAPTATIHASYPPHHRPDAQVVNNNHSIGNTNDGYYHYQFNSGSSFQSSYEIKSMHKWQTEGFHQQPHLARPDHGPATSTSNWQCLALLIVTAQAALDGTQSLWCRFTQRYLPIGNAMDTTMIHDRFFDTTEYPGNASSSSSSSLAMIAKHPRPDIASLLATSYLLLLYSQQEQQDQQPQRFMHPPPITAPSDYKAFTFVRCTLVPCLRTLSSSIGAYSRSNLAEFALSTVTSAYKQYLDRELSSGTVVFPVSRHVWLIEEQEELQLRKDQAIQQAQFMAAATWQSQQYAQGWGATSTPSADFTTRIADTVPDEVDLRTRPDCLDDIVALGITLAGLGAEYASSFFVKTTPPGSLGTTVASSSTTVCGTLQELGTYVAKKDPSVLPSYLSWMGALCQDTGSASIVHSILSDATSKKDSTSSTDAFSDGISAEDNLTTAPPIEYRRIIANLAWYARELSPYGGLNNSNTNNPTVTQTPTRDGSHSKTSNTAYYYSLDGDSEYSSTSVAAGDGDMVYGTRMKMTSGGAATASDHHGKGVTSKVHELSDTSRYYLGSHLALLRNVAQHSSQARLALLKIVLRFDDSTGSSSATTGDATLLILFRLAIAPLPPTLRGATLATIASLLQPSPDLPTSDQAFILEQARQGWDFMENCSLLPILLLDQYATVDPSKSVGLAMPPSSLQLANSGNLLLESSALLPKDPVYGILYEMEHVESQLGWYPATEGYLEVLSSLIQTAGCPPSLGEGWRIRTGVAPYVEYVTDFVLPRALGTQGLSKLPFRVPGDESRLVAKALHIVQVVMARYSVPVEALKVSGGYCVSSMELGMPSITQRFAPNTKSDEFVADFKTVSSPVQPPPQKTAMDSTQASSAVVVGHPLGNIPRAKSPGFAIMGDILSTSGRGGLLEALALVISGCGGSRGISSIFSSVGDKMALVSSTTADPPSDGDGTVDGRQVKPMHSLFAKLHPHIDGLVMDEIDFDRGGSWRESSVQVALEILCAVAVHEKAYFTAVTTTKNPLKIVPTLRFQKHRFGSSNLKMVHVAPSRLAPLLCSAPEAQNLRSAIVEYIGYSTLDDHIDSQISSAALCLAYFIQTKVRLLGGIQPLSSSNEPLFVADAFATRLFTAAQRSLAPWDIETTSLILNLILAELRTGTVTDGGLTQLLLGLPSRTQSGNLVPSKVSFANNDCFDAILKIVHGVSDVVSHEHSAVASLCMEILFRLYNLRGNSDPYPLRIALYTSRRLREVDFWTTNLVLWLSSRGLQPLAQIGSSDLHPCNPDALHYTAWLTKCLASELHLLVGFSDGSVEATNDGFNGLISPRPIICQQLLNLLFSPEDPLIFQLIRYLPFENVTMRATFVEHPPEDAIRSGLRTWPGPIDVSGEYHMVNKEVVLKTIRSMPSMSHSVVAIGEWIDEWNQVVARNCAASHLADGVASMIDAACAGYKTILALSTVHTSGIVPPTFLLSLSTAIVDRLLEGSDDHFRNGMDLSFYPNVTRNMSNAVLCLIDGFLAFEHDQGIVSARQILQLISMIARAVAYSNVGDDSDAEAPTRYERTTVLASALSMLLRMIGDDEPGLLLEVQGELLLAGQMLAKLVSLDSSHESSRAVSALARNCLVTMLEESRDCIDGHGTPFVGQLLHQTIVHDFSDMVARMDSNICLLLEVVARQPVGAEIILHSPILDAMESAALTYTGKQAGLAMTQAHEYQTTRAQVPDFLMSHLKLLVTMLDCSSVSPGSTQSGLALPHHTLRILGHFKITFKRLCDNFPLDADVLRAFLRCLVQAAFRAVPSDSSQGLDLLSSSRGSNIRSNPSFPQMLEDFGFGESGILSLYRHLLEHPLPAKLMPRLPPLLKSNTPTKNNANGHNLVNLNLDYPHSTEEQTWWAVLDMTLKTTASATQNSFEPPIESNSWFEPRLSESDKWSEITFEYAIAAADILGLTLTLMRKVRRWEDDLDFLMVCRGIQRYMLATKSVHLRLNQVRPEATTSDSWHVRQHIGTVAVDSRLFLESNYLTLLGSSFARNLECLLCELFRQVQYPSRDDFISKKESRIAPALSLDAKRSMLRLIFEPFMHSDTEGGAASDWLSWSKNPPKPIERIQFVNAVTKYLYRPF